MIVVVVVVIVVLVVVRVAVDGCCGGCRSPINGCKGTQRINRGRPIRGLDSQHGGGRGFSGTWRRGRPVNWESSGVLGNNAGRECRWPARG